MIVSLVFACWVFEKIVLFGRLHVYIHMAIQSHEMYNIYV